MSHNGNNHGHRLAGDEELHGAAKAAALVGFVVAHDFGRCELMLVGD